MFSKVASDISMLPREVRTLVTYARQAVNDTYSGGCRALTRAKKAKNSDAVNVVEAVYSASSGKVPDELEALEAFECGECGGVHLGREAADRCCSPEEVEVEVEVEDGAEDEG